MMDRIGQLFCISHEVEIALGPLHKSSLVLCYD